MEFLCQQLKLKTDILAVLLKCIPVSQVCLHPQSFSPKRRELNSKFLSLGRGLSACGIQEKGEGCNGEMHPEYSSSSVVTQT